MQTLAYTLLFYYIQISWALPMQTLMLKEHAYTQMGGHNNLTLYAKG